MTDEAAKGEGSGIPTPRAPKPKTAIDVAEWLPGEFRAEIENNSFVSERMPRRIAALAEFASSDDCRLVVEGLRKRGWSGSDISSLLIHAFWSHTWGSVHQARDWWSWTREERVLRVKTFARACRKLQHELAKLGDIIDEASLLLGRRTQERMLLYSLQGIDSHEPLIGDGIPRKNVLPNKKPLRTLADFVESLPDALAGEGRNDEHKARRRLVCGIAARLQLGKCSSWANFTSLLVSAVTGEDLSDSRVRQITKAHADLVQQAMERLVEKLEQREKAPSKRGGLLSGLLSGEKAD